MTDAATPTLIYAPGETGRKVILRFYDTNLNVTAPPVGAVVEFASSDTSVLTLTPDASDPSGDTQDLTFVVNGTASVSCAINGSDGNPLPLPSGGGVFSVSPLLLVVATPPPPAASATLSVE
jgi:hypothetical protein